ncbi:MAG: SRPBCC family protein [Pseudonocardiaceae bacterium]
MAPITTTTTTEVDRAPAEVFDYVTDPTRFVEWQRNVVAGHMDTDGPTTVGTTCLTTRRIGFAERAVTAEVTHIDPPRTWGVHGIDGPIRAIVDVTVDPLDDGRRSRLTIEVRGPRHRQAARATWRTPPSPQRDAGKPAHRETTPRRSRQTHLSGRVTRQRGYPRVRGRCRPGILRTHV